MHYDACTLNDTHSGCLDTFLTQLENGGVKRMDELAIGDRVLAFDASKSELDHTRTMPHRRCKLCTPRTC